MPSSLSVAAQRIARLQTEIYELKMQNDALLEQFVKWQYNAYKHGMTPAKLDAPLPTIDRNSSEKNG